MKKNNYLFVTIVLICAGLTGIFFQNCSTNTSFEQTGVNSSETPAADTTTFPPETKSTWTLIDQQTGQTAYGRGIAGIATKIIDGQPTVLAAMRWYGVNPSLFQAEITRGSLTSGPQIAFTAPADFYVDTQTYDPGQGAYLTDFANFKETLIATGYSQNNNGLTSSWNFVISSDGKNWSTYFDAAVGAGNKYPSRIAASPTMAVVYNNKDLFYSTTGLQGSWNKVNGDFPYVNKIIWTGSYFVASTITALFYKSSDGINWSSFSVPAANVLSRIAYGNGVYVLINGKNIFTTSNINVSSPQWTARMNPIVDSPNLTDVHFSNGTFAIVASENSKDTYHILSSQSQGINWIEDESSLPNSTNGPGELFSAYGKLIATRSPMGGGGINIVYKDVPKK